MQHPYTKNKPLHIPLNNSFDILPLKVFRERNSLFFLCRQMGVAKVFNTIDHLEKLLSSDKHPKAEFDVCHLLGLESIQTLSKEQAEL